MLRHHGHRGRAVRPNRGESVTDALLALTLDELRAFVLDTLNGLNDGQRGELEDALLRRAALGDSGWRPTAPPSATVNEVKAFADHAQRAGEASPSAVDDYLRQGITASLAGDHIAARGIFEALLNPIANGDVYLGQDEMVEEVLTVDLNDCVTRYAAAVYITTPLPDCAVAVSNAVEPLTDFASFTDAFQALESVLGGAIPDRDAFLDLWIAHLERDPKSSSNWESDRERWLRCSIGRRDGVAGLERIARATKSHAAVRAWCEAVEASGDWSKALRAYEEAAVLVGSGLWRGDFLDRAALAAQVLRRKDLLKKLEAAWLGAPSLSRLLRWLLRQDPNSKTLRKRAAKALQASPTKSPRVVGFLQLLVGDLESSATLLEKGAGLGWSSGDHPGHLLFPVFAWMLGGAPTGSVRDELTQVLHRETRSELDYGLDSLNASTSPKDASPRLVTPSLIDVLRAAEVTEHLTTQDRVVLLRAMKSAATKRANGVLNQKRRRHYGHAAALVACCVELEDGTETANGTSEWAEALRIETARFYAFQRELRAALSKVRPINRGSDSPIPRTSNLQRMPTLRKP